MPRRTTVLHVKKLQIYKLTTHHKLLDWLFSACDFVVQQRINLALISLSFKVKIMNHFTLSNNPPTHTLIHTHVRPLSTAFWSWFLFPIKREILSCFLSFVLKIAKNKKECEKTSSQFLIFSFAWAHLGWTAPTLTFSQRKMTKIKNKIKRLKWNKKTHVGLTFCILVEFLLSNRIWSFTICNQVTEAWLAPFVCGVYFVLCLIWKTGGGAVWRAEPHPPNEITI